MRLGTVCSSYEWIWNLSWFPDKKTHTMMTHIAVHSRLYLVINNYWFIAVVKLPQKLPAFRYGGFSFWEESNPCESAEAEGKELHGTRFKEASASIALWGVKGPTPGSERRNPELKCQFVRTKSKEIKQAVYERSWDLPAGCVSWVIKESLERRRTGREPRRRFGSHKHWQEHHRAKYRKALNVVLY